MALFDRGRDEGRGHRGGRSEPWRDARGVRYDEGYADRSRATGGWRHAAADDPYQNRGAPGGDPGDRVREDARRRGWSGYDGDLTRGWGGHGGGARMTRSGRGYDAGFDRDRGRRGYDRDLHAGRPARGYDRDARGGHDRGMRGDTDAGDPFGDRAGRTPIRVLRRWNRPRGYDAGYTRHMIGDEGWYGADDVRAERHARTYGREERDRRPREDRGWRDWF